MRKIITIILLAMSIITISPEIADAVTANERSMIFHTDYCEYGLKARHKVYFRNRYEAIEAGYRPCNYCTP